MQATAYPKRPSRPAQVRRPGAGAVPNTRVHDWAQASGRMLVSTFFIATSVSNMGESSFGFGDMSIAEPSLMFNALIYSMAFAVLVGRFVHIAALLLALALLWTSTAELSNGTQDLASYWQDLAIIGALFFMAASKSSAMMPALSRAFSRSQAVTPRRVVPESRLGADQVSGAKMHMSRNSVARPVAMPMFVSRRAEE